MHCTCHCPRSMHGAVQLPASKKRCRTQHQGLQQKTPLGRIASAPVMVMLLAAIAAANHAIPTACAVYDTVWQYVMPLAAALCLLEVDLTDLRRLWGTVGPTAVAFVIGAIGVVLGTFAGWCLLGTRLGSEGAKLAAALCASFIGGSINFAATAAALGLPPGPLLAGAMAADNVAMALYLAVISSWPVPDRSQTGGSAGDAAVGSVSDLHAAAGQTAPPATLPPAPTFASRMVLAVAAAAVACWAGSQVASAIGFQGGSLACMAVVASMVSAAASSLGDGSETGQSSALSESPFAGSGRLGGALMLPFFATIGAAAGSLQALPAIGSIFALIAIQLTVHVAVSVIGGRMMRLPMEAILTASNANVGGVGTASATASARGWGPDAIASATLTGSIGYTIGTAIGVAVGHVLH